MKLLRTGYGLREMRRFAAITGVLVKHGFGDLVDRRSARRQPKPGAGLAR